MSVTIDGACSLCHDRVSGRGADIFEALAAAEVDHFEATKCRGEPVEVSCRVPPVRGPFGSTKRDRLLWLAPPSWSRIEKRPPPPPAQRPAPMPRRIGGGGGLVSVSSLGMCRKCGEPEEVCDLNGCPTPLPTPDLDLFERIKK